MRGLEGDEDAYDADTMISDKENIHNMSKFSLLNVVKKRQLFENKTLLKATFEICAMKHNFHYEVIKTDRQLWYVRCEDNACNWCVLAECLKDSAYSLSKSAKEGPKCNDIIQIMCMDHGCAITKSLAWDAREYVVDEVRVKMKFQVRPSSKSLAPVP
ncbi:hypothetical protein DY000_02046885 [Brassica cretica]|uniref:Transposase MuDR plant domain-containing protein n=1 Tax=Brassica cretica TaxID=69181 RepID=A0ABQ7F6C5_BRACR|nr:hypothetical protein DY000_02046885 [Brassica cretica]